MSEFFPVTVEKGGWERQAQTQPRVEKNGGLGCLDSRKGKVSLKSREKPKPTDSRLLSGRAGVAAPRKKGGVGRVAKSEPHPAKKKAKVVVTCRPGLLRRLSPTNLKEAERIFFQSNCTEAPCLVYPDGPAASSRDAEKHSKVHFEYLGLAEDILRIAKKRYGDSSAYMSVTYGTETVSPEEFKDQVARYVSELGMWQKVDVRFAPNVLAIASVTRCSPRSEYVISIQKDRVLGGMTRPICDHEAGTHLIRMANECGQAWFNRKQSWGLRNHRETEEGLATINSLLSLKHSLLLWSPALRYYATCKAVNLGFVELFEELRQFVDDPVRRFRLCVRVKRGLRDLSLPGAVNIDQSYFCGSVDILRHFRDFDIPLLYAGQIAIQDIDKVRRLVRPEMCLLPPFLSSAASVLKYRSFLENVAAENCIAPATVRLFKSPFIEGSIMMTRRAAGISRTVEKKGEVSRAD